MAEYLDQDSTPSEKALRFFALLLFNNRAYSLSELASLLNMSRPAISRLVASFENAWVGSLIREKRGREIFVRLERSQMTGKASLNPAGLEELFLCRELLANLLPDAMRERMAATLAQTAVFLPEAKYLQRTIPALAVPKGKIDYSPYQEIFSKLLEAIREKRVCLVKYAAKMNGEAKAYFFAPKKLLSYNDSLYIEGWKVTESLQPELVYDDALRLSLQRFRDCEITEASSAHLSETPGENGAFGLMEWEEFEIKVRFWGNSAQYAMERQWSAEQKVEILPEDESIVMTLAVNNAPETISWLLSFGDTAQLLEPDWLVREFKGMLRRMRERYRKGQRQHELFAQNQ